MGLKQIHGVLLGFVTHQPEVGAHRDLAYVTRHEILYKFVRYLSIFSGIKHTLIETPHI